MTSHLLAVLTTDVIRYAVAVEMLLLLACTTFLHTLHGATLPRPLLVMGRGLLSVVAGLAVAVVANALVGPPPTPGVYVIAVVALPATLGGLALVGRAVRTARR